jgi:hypothetical protein
MGAKQPTLWEQPAPIPVADPHVPAQEKPRLMGCSQRILARLQRGPATNIELAKITPRYGGRLYDLKKAGVRWRIVERNYDTGVNTYSLEAER